MNHLNFIPAGNYGQPNFGCSPEQQSNHINMCNFIDQQRRIQELQYKFYNQKSYIQKQPRLVYKAVPTTVAMNRNQNYWMHNLVNF